MKKASRALLAILCCMQLAGCAYLSAALPAAASAEPSAARAYSTAPLQTATPKPTKTKTPEPTPTPTPLNEDEVRAFSELIERSECVLIATVAQDIGIVNVAQGMSALAPNACLGEHQYEIKIVSVMKLPDGLEISAGDIRLYSSPYEYSVDGKRKEMMPQKGFIELKEGESFLLFARYEDNFGFLCPENFEPCRFAAEDGWLYIHTADEDVSAGWLKGKGEKGIRQEVLEAAALDQTP